MNFLRLLALVGLLCCTASHAATVSLKPTSITATAGSSFSVDVVVDGLTGGQLVGGFDLDLVFDASVLAANNVVFGSALGVPGVDQFTNAILSAGRIDFAAVSLLAGADLMSLQAGPFSIAQLIFDALAPGASILSFDLITAPGLLFSDEFGTALAVNAGDQVDVRINAAGGGGTSLPEPGSLALVLLALVGVTAAQRRRRQR